MNEHIYHIATTDKVTHLKTCKLKLNVLSQNGEVEKMEGHCVRVGVPLLGFLPKAHLFSQEGKVGLVCCQAQHDLQGQSRCVWLGAHHKSKWEGHSPGQHPDRRDNDVYLDHSSAGP